MAITLPADASAPKRSAMDASPVPTTTVYDPAIGLVDTAYVPASSLRGTLRRAGHEALNRRQVALGREPLNLRSFYMLRIGGIKSKGSDGLSKDVTAELELRKKNPFLSLFGAADAGVMSFLAGRLEVDHALPAHPIAPDRCPVYNGMRTDDMLRSPSQSMELLDPSAADAWRNLFQSMNNTSALKARKKTLKADAVKAARAKDQEARDRANAELAQIDESLSTADNSIAQPLPGYRAIPAGVRLDHGLALNRASLAEIGCLLDALDAMAADPVVGGHRNHGCGKIEAHWKVTQLTYTAGGGASRETLGSIRIDADQGMVVEGEALKALEQQAIQAWGQSVDDGDFAYPEVRGAEKADA
ncbi:MAG: hypothetical protein ACRER5_03095 [Pseudomonas sp.]